MRRVIAAMIVAATLGACNERAGMGNTAVQANEIDPMESKIQALPEPLRRTTFFRAIQDAGYTCQTISRVDQRPRDGTQPVWAVTCDDGGAYLIVLKPGGIFNVSGVPQPKRPS